jgi:hypothetical protein
MKLIAKFSEKKAQKAVINSSKIEGYKVVRDKSIKIKAHRLALKLCS